MNPFESDLLKARRRHRIIMMGAVMVGVIVVVAIVVGLYAGNGTRIEVLPQDTRDTAVVRVVAGAAVAFKGVVYSLGATPTVAVSADGFETATAVISHAQKARTVTITLKEIPATLTIVTEPPRQETRWAIDDNPPQIAEQITQTVPSGRHRLRIENPYFKKEVLELDLKRAENRRITMPLGAISGKVRIATQPDSAKVRIEGKEVGVSPVEVELPGGRHRVTVTKEGYLDLIDRIEIRNDRLSHARNYILQRRSATLAFSVVHKGGVLLLNGKEISPSQSRKVSANQAHQVTYALAGYITETKVVTLKPDETRLLRFKLKPDLGVVDILVEPGGDIFMDGKRAGKDALTLKLPSWRHRLDVFRKGYRTVTRNFQPSSGRKTVLNIVMETELAARLRETPETYTNSAGIRLARFKPGSIIMGAPRHETGQRANEILREVYLKKYFYAALHEVTEAQYGKFSGKAGGNLPVVSVTWLDAASFCNWLSLKEGLPPFYSIKEGKLRAVNAAADGYRFLTEAEWEWLARRAGKTAQTTFTWGDKPLVPRGAGNIADENANGITRYYVPNYNDGHKQRAPVGRFPAEPSGLFDLTGNVREWVHDSYSIILPIKGKVMVDPVYTTLGDVHTVKGSSWKTGTRSPLRAAYREGLSGSRDDIGFRIGRYLYGQDISAKN